MSNNIEKTEYESKLLDVARVTRVVAGGRRFRFRAVVVIGNKNGKVGVGAAKGQDVTSAVGKATAKARKHLIKVHLLSGTIPYSVEAKYGSAKVLLKPAPRGRGLVAGGAVRVVCDLVGIESISAKILGKTKNKLNNAKAAIEALKSLKSEILNKS
ncbi:MAG: 30S ribosomal protein S5 [Candidatus Portnoybacteria bacterium RIFCSPLOWO2_01_FULL_43_11]|uniref:Small ribosomal subunit protein uS5 n=4 Tax=Candidatus Portnoyibacteriota TaxID=1817913 RepID=A0A1G2FCS4_9BACT|nr:MAG: 30S ribosomal protein S5 [Candidatus Portnoybacteria bacterium RIFCSPHIGHO2_01_FULL_40_12b]OGZ36188.1 MAG: 30S ribosomal protein S5 [Candidatus Portnoybacteria bacterium RIFCSPHIGHO2_02_FULL_40_23]OGZ38846.1 MAG: 30S ribosomal protein S5 [Candidatus Portnoybacteria bacterium RIFCSPLOWO2_01_FULL_43_11]OGZ39436.1 MAG: 30S ribosomal protein S5 [Candidatus Portnoybacteria bacterium RIFCSPHIGHO2_12_FULL_40_11]OGZ40540.1 MAG: 30S ribosomal protein S5 [Candidatus Portnoybacteria bacterium RIFC